jgi:hypothetical protein
MHDFCCNCSSCCSQPANSSSHALRASLPHATGHFCTPCLPILFSYHLQHKLQLLLKPSGRAGAEWSSAAHTGKGKQAGGSRQQRKAGTYCEKLHEKPHPVATAVHVTCWHALPEAPATSRISLPDEAAVALEKQHTTVNLQQMMHARTTQSIRYFSTLARQPQLSTALFITTGPHSVLVTTQAELCPHPYHTHQAGVNQQAVM